jgi:hypothetical protein
MFDSVKNMFKKIKNDSEKDKDKDNCDKKEEKALEDLIQNSNSDQTTNSKSFSSSFYLENIEVERKILNEILKDEMNSVNPNELFEKFKVKLSKWK